LKTLLFNLFFLTKLFKVFSSLSIGQLIFKNSLIIFAILHKKMKPIQDQPHNDQRKESYEDPD